MQGPRRRTYCTILCLPCVIIAKVRHFCRAKVSAVRRKLFLRYKRIPKTQKSLLDQSSDPAEQSSPFLRLPIELRLRIYQLACEGDRGLSAGRRVIHPCIGRHRLFLLYHGPYPPHWPPGQCIRSDLEPPSRYLPTMIALGASAHSLIRAPPRRGCVVHGIDAISYCGDQRGAWGFRFLHDGLQYCDPTKLLRVCKTTYLEVMPMLYSNNTFMLWGPEMVHFLPRNIGQDGLRCIRYIHLILRLDVQAQSGNGSKQKIMTAVNGVKKHFCNLEQLDVELLITWDHPADPAKLWEWLIHSVFSQLGGLREFVLKISVLKQPVLQIRERYRLDDWKPLVEPLASWNEGDYQRLKATITSRIE